MQYITRALWALVGQEQTFLHYASAQFSETAVRDKIAVVTGLVMTTCDSFQQYAKWLTYTHVVPQYALRAAVKISLQFCTVHLV